MPKKSLMDEYKNIRVTVIGNNLSTVEDREQADKESSVFVIRDTPSVVTFSS